MILVHYLIMKKFARRRSSKRRFSRRTGRNSITRPSTLVAMPKYLSPGMPNQMSVTLRASFQTTLSFAAAGAQAGYFAHECWVPGLATADPLVGANWLFAMGFLDLMRVYGKCQVTKAKFQTRIETFDANPSSVAQVAVAFIPTQRLANYVGNDGNNFRQFMDLPTTKVGNVGVSTGGAAAITLTTSVDLASFQAAPLDHSQAIFRGPTAAAFDLRWPSPSVGGNTLPNHVCYISRTANTQLSTYSITYTADFTCNFSSVVPSPITLITAGSSGGGAVPGPPYLFEVYPANA